MYWKSWTILLAKIPLHIFCDNTQLLLLQPRNTGLDTGLERNYQAGLKICNVMTHQFQKTRDQDISLLTFSKLPRLTSTQIASFSVFLSFGASFFGTTPRPWCYAVATCCWTKTPFRPVCPDWTWSNLTKCHSAVFTNTIHWPSFAKSCLFLESKTTRSRTFCFIFPLRESTRLEWTKSFFLSRGSRW